MIGKVFEGCTDTITVSNKKWDNLEWVSTGLHFGGNGKGENYVSINCLYDAATALGYKPFAKIVHEGFTECFHEYCYMKDGETVVFNGVKDIVKAII